MVKGPLTGIKIVEFAAIGPAPFCAMLLSDMGADIIRIDRKGAAPRPKHQIQYRGRRSVALDLKKPEAVKAALKLIEHADALIEGFRPGVMERFGLGPNEALARNPRLVYGRMTGWGQTGPLAKAAGHDINYLALTGALHMIGPKERPVIPANLIADYGGGAMYLAFGVLAALLHAQKTGEGQVVDAAMVDGTVHMMAQIWGNLAGGVWKDERESNYTDGGAHFYNVYECADGKFIALGAIEPQFYQLMLDKAGIKERAFDEQWERARWPELKSKLAAVIKQKARDKWRAIMEGTDACFAPVLSLHEVPQHPVHQARGNFTSRDGITQPNPAPKLSKTPGAIQGGIAALGEHNDSALADWGFSQSEIAALKSCGAL
ncbi:MAG: CaiB/BaiF CoA-transferase family protein [Alphaproteobacteria bacterium]